MLFKRFLDLNRDGEPVNASSFSKNRQRLLDADAARAFLGEVVLEARRRRLLSRDHLTVDRTMFQAWATHTSYRPRDGLPPRDAPPDDGSRGAALGGC